MRRLDNTTKHILRDPAKRWAWIIYQITLQGRSLAAVAREHGVTRECIYKASRGPYPRMEKLIADALDMTPTQLFPERYGPDGLPNRLMGRPPKLCSPAKRKPTTSGGRRNIYSNEAA